MGVSITIDSKYVELKNRLIGHKSISFKEQYKVVWRLYNRLICKIDNIAFKKLKYGYSSYIKEISMMKKKTGYVKNALKKCKKIKKTKCKLSI